MLTRHGDQLRWSESDRATMARCVGPSRRPHVAYNPAVVKLALRLGVPTAAELVSMLHDEQFVRANVRAAANTPATKSQHDTHHEQRVTFYPHQTQDLLAIWEAARSGYTAIGLFHEVGVGKTPVAIRWAENLLLQTRANLGDPRPARALIVCTNKAKQQWAREIRRWAHVDPSAVAIVHGTKREQEKQLIGDTDWTIAHWESLVHARDAVLTRPWTAVVLDETHWIQNRKAQRTLTAYDLDTNNRLALTAHPYTSNLDELWSILHWLYPDRYRSFWQFFAMYAKATPKPFGGFELEGIRRKKLLRWELSAFTFRRTKRQVFPSLPSIVRKRFDLELPRKYAQEYETLRKQFFVELTAYDGQDEKVLIVPSVLARVTRLRQHCVDPGLLGSSLPSLKYPAILEILESLERPPVIFTSFRRAAVRLGVYLWQRKIKTTLLAGGMTMAQENHARHLFFKKKQPMIVITKAGSESLNLGGFGYVIYLDLPWTPRTLEQSEGRVDRPEEGTGRLVPTTAFRLTTLDTYEERLEQLLTKKHRIFHSLFTVGVLRQLFQEVA